MSCYPWWTRRSWRWPSCNLFYCVHRGDSCVYIFKISDTEWKMIRRIDLLSVLDEDELNVLTFHFTVHVRTKLVFMCLVDIAESDSIHAHTRLQGRKDWRVCLKSRADQTTWERNVCAPAFAQLCFIACIYTNTCKVLRNCIFVISLHLCYISGATSHFFHLASCPPCRFALLNFANVRISVRLFVCLWTSSANHGHVQHFLWQASELTRRVCGCQGSASCVCTEKQSISWARIFVRTHVSGFHHDASLVCVLGCVLVRVCKQARPARGAHSCSGVRSLGPSIHQEQVRSLGRMLQDRDHTLAYSWYILMVEMKSSF